LSRSFDARIAQLGERLSYKQEVAGSIPALRTRRRIAQRQSTCLIRRRPLVRLQLRLCTISRGRSSAVERSPETRGGAGSIPAGHAFGFVAQQEEPPTLNRCGAGSTPAGAAQASRATPIWKGCHGCGTPSRKRAGLRALGVRLPPLPLVKAWPSWQGSALLPRRRCEPFAGSSPAASVFRSGVVESGRRATVNRERQVRALPPELSCPRGRNGDDAGPSTRKLRVRVPPGVLIDRSSGCRGVGHPTGFGRRRSQVRLLPARLAR
jgi:hypothetical protein